MPSTTTRPRTSGELEEAVRQGATDISPDDIAAAHAREHHDRLVAEATSRQQIGELDATRVREVEQLRADIAAVGTDAVEEIAALATAADHALDALVRATTARNGALELLATRARKLGITPLAGSNVASDPSGVGWAAGPGRAAALAMDFRTINGRLPLDVVDRIVIDVTARHRLHARTWRAGLAPSVEEQLRDLDRLVEPAATVAVRLVRRWGQHQAGVTVEVDTSTSRWLIQHQLAEPAA